jgi:hypothetical protein
MRILDIAYLSPTSFSKRELKLTTESPYSLVVPKDMGAIDATRIAELNRIGVICVVNSLPTDPLEGRRPVFFVRTVLQRKKPSEEPTGASNRHP